MGERFSGLVVSNGYLLDLFTGTRVKPDPLLGVLATPLFTWSNFLLLN